MNMLMPPNWLFLIGVNVVLVLIVVFLAPSRNTKSDKHESTQGME